MSVFAGLFTNLDSVVREWELSSFSDIKPKKPGGVLKKPGEVLHALGQDEDSEHFITKEIFEWLNTNFRKDSVRIGGNAGNAAVALGSVGIPCVVSCPVRPKPIMEKLGKYNVRIVRNGELRSPESCIRRDHVFEHICFEERTHRHIFTWDEMSSDFWMDFDFWKKTVDCEMLWLSGFHLVSPKYREKVNMVMDYLKGRKFRVHLEAGMGTETIRYAIKTLIENGCVDSLGMSENEAGMLGFKDFKNLYRLGYSLFDFISEYNLERITIHKRDWRMTAFKNNQGENMKAAEYSSVVSAARTFGEIGKNLYKAQKLKKYNVKPIRESNFILVPSCVTPEPVILTGLGDVSSAIDAVTAMK